ncbi:unnamed protein product [Lactuca virosa]|uniref:Uncharacterized protein n=1 Tax=Lactuca virosa TaxID=75947 RepID=A0AAU9P6W4_9ASTR|nr:unnamed protein product [Lactuca virosa]
MYPRLNAVTGCLVHVKPENHSKERIDHRCRRFRQLPSTRETLSLTTAFTVAAAVYRSPLKICGHDGDKVDDWKKNIFPV